MNRTEITIFSRPIQTGKTTELMSFVKGKNAGGILTPDIDGRRMLYDIQSAQYHEFERTDGNIIIGRFSFSHQAMQKAKEIIARAVACEMIIIDEVGKLELRCEGLEPVVSQLIASGGSSLLLVIRDSLVHEAVDRFSLQNARVIRSLNDY